MRRSGGGMVGSERAFKKRRKGFGTRRGGKRLERRRVKKGITGN